MGINVPYIDRIRMPGTQNVYHTVLLENPESQPAWSMEQALKDLLEFTNELMQEKFEKALKPGEHGRERWLARKEFHHEIMSSHFLLHMYLLPPFNPGNFLAVKVFLFAGFQSRKEC